MSSFVVNSTNYTNYYLQMVEMCTVRYNLAHYYFHHITTDGTITENHIWIVPRLPPWSSAARKFIGFAAEKQESVLMLCVQTRKWYSQRCLYFLSDCRRQNHGQDIKKYNIIFECLGFTCCLVKSLKPRIRSVHVCTLNTIDTGWLFNYFFDKTKYRIIQIKMVVSCTHTWWYNMQLRDAETMSMPLTLHVTHNRRVSTQPL